MATARPITPSEAVPTGLSNTAPRAQPIPSPGRIRPTSPSKTTSTATANATSPSGVRPNQAREQAMPECGSSANPQATTPPANSYGAPPETVQSRHLTDDRRPRKIMYNGKFVNIISVNFFRRFLVGLLWIVFSVSAFGQEKSNQRGFSPG